MMQTTPAIAVVTDTVRVAVCNGRRRLERKAKGCQSDALHVWEQPCGSLSVARRSDVARSSSSVHLFPDAQPAVLQARVSGASSRTHATILYSLCYCGYRRKYCRWVSVWLRV